MNSGNLYVQHSVHVTKLCIKSSGVQICLPAHAIVQYTVSPYHLTAHLNVPQKVIPGKFCAVKKQSSALHENTYKLISGKSLSPLFLCPPYSPPVIWAESLGPTWPPKLPTLQGWGWVVCLTESFSAVECYRLH